MNLQQHAQIHIEGARRFNCSLVWCDYSSWTRQDIQKHMRTINHTHATIIDNQSPELQVQITQMVIQCFGEINKRRKYATNKPAVIRCNKCSVTVRDLPAYRKQHAKMHITDVGQFGCSAFGCGYNTWWKSKLCKHIQQHKNATVVDDQGLDLQQRVADMAIECFGTLTSSDPTVREHAGTEQIPMETNDPDAIDSNHEAMNAQITDAVEADSKTNHLVTSPLTEDCGLPGSVKWQNMLERVERVKQTIDALTKRYETLKKR